MRPLVGGHRFGNQASTGACFLLSRALLPPPTTAWHLYPANPSAESMPGAGHHFLLVKGLHPSHTHCKRHFLFIITPNHFFLHLISPGQVPWVCPAGGYTNIVRASMCTCSPALPWIPTSPAKNDFQLTRMPNSQPVLQVILVDWPRDSAERELRCQLLPQQEFILCASERNRSGGVLLSPLPSHH